MKETLIALCAILAVCTARVVITAQGAESPALLGANECTWGPSYWCESIRTASGCNAVKHCIRSVWETMKVPEDNDNVCTICKDMVQQARDQLESNQTQNDLKAVFEGSCKLMIIKPIVKECITVADQFIPELVETLASQMNPSVVCSVAGLCNSAHIDKLLLEYEETHMQLKNLKSPALKNDELEPDECSKCYTVAAHMQHKFSSSSRDKVLEQMLNVCGELGSFSDACSSIILTHFETIYSHLKENLNAENVCHLSGQCTAKFHKHEEDKETTPKVDIRPLSTVGIVEVGDDLPCKLCEQLVGHLRDLLVANTTEAEFQHVLDGLCTQTKSFATECTAIVDEYYPEIYEYLTKGLNKNLACQMAGICPSPANGNVPIWPLIPQQQREIGIRILQGSKVEAKDQKEEATLDNSEIAALQLPIERMVPFGLVPEGKQTCALCEYLLHYIQEAITSPTNTEKVKEVLGKVCSKIPRSLEDECKLFIDTYGDAVVAILAQEIDPSQVCPMLRLCPSQELLDAFKSIPKEYMLVEEVEEKPSCPLCLLAVTQIYNAIKDNKTEANIEAQLDKLCEHLPKSLVEECTDLVKGYSKQLVEMLLADLSPQEVCVYIKLCDTSKNVGPAPEFVTDKHGEIMTNEIPQYPLEAATQKVESDVTCVICEFAMQYVDKAIGNRKSKDEIERVVHGVCNHLPKTISKECNSFVDQYADVLIDILSQEVSPKEACSMMGLCKVNMEQIEASIAECAVCQAVLSTIDKLLGDSKVDAEIEDAVAKVCKYMPSSKHDKCVEMIEVYGQSVINLLRKHDNPEKVCSKMALCSNDDYLAMSLRSPRMRRSNKRSINTLKRCTWGIEFVCNNKEVARECNVTKQCAKYLQENSSGSENRQITQSEVIADA